MQFTAKQLKKQSEKNEKDCAKEKKNVVKAIEKGNLEGAKIYAANTIRKKNEALQMLQLSSRIDGVASKLKSISSQRNVARSMGAISSQLGMAMQQMDTMAIASSMDVFERQLQELDVQGTMISTVMDGSTASSTPVDEVDVSIGTVARAATQPYACRFSPAALLLPPPAFVAVGTAARA